MGEPADESRPGQPVPAAAPAPPVAAARPVPSDLLPRLAAIVRGTRLRPSWRWRWPRLRLLPAIVVVSFLMLWFRVEDFAHDLSALPLPDAGRPSLAQESHDAAAEPATAFAAEEPDGPTPPDAQAPMQAQDGPATQAVASTPPDAAFDPQALTESEVAVLQDLARRRDALDDREHALRQQEALLAVAEQRLEQKMTELEALRTQIEGMLQIIDAEQQGQLDSLVRIYEAMRPSDAAAIFDGLALDVLINVFERMSERKSAPILAGMNPERAREVTTQLAERQRSAAAQALQ